MLESPRFCANSLGTCSQVMPTESDSSSRRGVTVTPGNRVHARLAFRGSSSKSCGCASKAKTWPRRPMRAAATRLMYPTLAPTSSTVSPGRTSRQMASVTTRSLTPTCRSLAPDRPDSEPRSLDPTATDRRTYRRAPESRPAEQAPHQLPRLQPIFRFGKLFDRLQHVCGSTSRHGGGGTRGRPAATIHADGVTCDRCRPSDVVPLDRRWPLLIKGRPCVDLLFRSRS